MTKKKIPPQEVIDFRLNLKSHINELILRHTFYEEVLSGAEIAALPEVLAVVTDGHGVCVSCEQPRPLHAYTYEYPEVSPSDTQLCWRCLTSRLTGNLELLRFRQTYSEDDIRSTLFPVKIAPLHKEERSDCYVCGKLGLTEVESASNKWLLIDVEHRYWLRESQKVKAHVGCLYQCPECDTFGISRDFIKTVDGVKMCHYCVDAKEVWHCEGCSYLTEYEENVYYSDLRDGYYCGSCYTSTFDCSNCGRDRRENDDHDCDYDSESSSVINHYSYKPRPKFFGDSHIHMGFELEVDHNDDNESNDEYENRDDAAEKVADILGDHAYLKEDGSLNTGFEIVTHPHSLDEYHKLDWSFLKTIRNYGMRSWDTTTCGLHVHIGIKAFVNKSHEARFTKFIYDNEAQVTKLAGRASDFASFNHKGKAVEKIMNKGRGWERYAAVNVNNPHTLEVRVFRGSLRKERVLSAIEFVHAVAEFTRSMELSARKRPFAWSRFVAYVTSNAELYSNLFIIMNELFDIKERVLQDVGTLQGEGV
jgi:hypothetical protein